MNKKGFTLVELLAVIILLGLVFSFAVVSIKKIFDNTKEKSEDVFVETIKDALDVYLATDAKELLFNSKCGNTLDKSYEEDIEVFWTTIKMDDVIGSSMSPIKNSDLRNPANKKKCDDDISIYIYKDAEHVYYYSVNKVDFDCLLDDEGIISNLPRVNNSGIEDYFQCG